MPPRAQPGEGIVVVVDVGPGVRAGTDVTFYSQSKKCLTNILQRKMLAEKCRDQVGNVLLVTNSTSNRLAQADQYQHITVMREPQTVDWEVIIEVDQCPYGNTSGDWLDALVVAMDLLHDPE